MTIFHIPSVRKSGLSDYVSHLLLIKFGKWAYLGYNCGIFIFFVVEKSLKIITKFRIKITIFPKISFCELIKKQLLGRYKMLNFSKSTLAISF